ncbi:hypothetical protein E2C01_094673 [Portunus trituberculatus]|uniref:Uncharacterized protein n=1 Tax=Portunus trituberculatus TaxID=210409 RepID=A0A5B7JWR8_PORTR|nr:hypothetical protein [Portunus trituberculatus]
MFGISLHGWRAEGCKSDTRGLDHHSSDWQEGAGAPTHLRWDATEPLNPGQPSFLPPRPEG